MKDRKNKTKISQYTIEELVLFRDISPVITVGLPMILEVVKLAYV